VSPAYVSILPTIIRDPRMNCKLASALLAAPVNCACDGVLEALVLDDTEVAVVDIKAVVAGADGTIVDDGTTVEGADVVAVDVVTVDVLAVDVETVVAEAVVEGTDAMIVDADDVLSEETSGTGVVYTVERVVVAEVCGVVERAVT
jgi:hypothetical protein